MNMSVQSKLIKNKLGLLKAGAAVRQRLQSLQGDGI